MTTLEIVLIIVTGVLLFGNIIWWTVYSDATGLLKKRLEYSENEKLKERYDEQVKSLIRRRLSSLDHYKTEQLEQELEERKLKQNYPLAYEIKQLDCEFVELYEDGKFKDKYTKDYAWEYVKKYGKDKNIVYKAIK